MVNGGTGKINIGGNGCGYEIGGSLPNSPLPLDESRLLHEAEGRPGRRGDHPLFPFRESSPWLPAEADSSPRTLAESAHSTGNSVTKSVSGRIVVHKK